MLTISALQSRMSLRHFSGFLKQIVASDKAPFLIFICFSINFALLCNNDFIYICSICVYYLYLGVIISIIEKILSCLGLKLMPIVYVQCLLRIVITKSFRTHPVSPCLSCGEVSRSQLRVAFSILTDVGMVHICFEPPLLLYFMNKAVFYSL